MTRLFAKRPAGDPEDYAVMVAPTGSRFTGGGGQDPLAKLKEAARRDKEAKASEGGQPAPEGAGEGENNTSAKLPVRSSRSGRWRHARALL